MYIKKEAATLINSANQNYSGDCKVVCRSFSSLTKYFLYFKPMKYHLAFTEICNPIIYLITPDT